jgi:hypothetical protein
MLQTETPMRAAKRIIAMTMSSYEISSMTYCGAFWVVYHSEEYGVP